ncbi:MAG: MgtC/SapB family protein [Alicyclobacillaceae bacterium]|nr:MgtC/SapB family protein [Alicyclobacillaceae bacterium]
MELLQELSREANVLGPMILRLLIAFLAGAIIGVERELHVRIEHGKGAGFRTYSLVTFGSCLYALASIYGFPANNQGGVDPGRVAAQVVTGIGFLGAGTILKEPGGMVRGLTTAASLWVAASIGLLIGAGLYVTGLLASVLVYIILRFYELFPNFPLLRRFEDLQNEREQSPEQTREGPPSQS